MASRGEWPDGFSHLPLHFDAPAQAALVAEVARAVEAAPFFQPRMPGSGTPTSVVMSNFGPLGWVASRSGYRYQETHPDTGAPWPAMPRGLLELWRDVTDWPDPPQCCLINWYREDRDARMGYHVDADEEAADAPIVSVSLGDAATYRLGNLTRGGRTLGVMLLSGDVVVLAGESRRRFHAVTKVDWGSSALLPGAAFPGGGRLNLTLRRVTRAR